jgi:hypothetical protein
MEEGNADRAARLIESIEQDLRTLRQLVFGENAPAPRPQQHFAAEESAEDQAIEGIFDGEKMVDYAGKAYQVSANYASKSKLVEGDPLKLYVTHDGKYFYKQLGPVPRRNVAAVVRAEGNHYVLEAEDGTSYGVLTASVTYYMSMYNLREGDRVMVLLPSEGPAHWGVIDNVL